MTCFAWTGRLKAWRRAALALVLALAGCALGPDYRRPAVELPARFPGEPAATAEAPPAMPHRWWVQFEDAELNRLMELALRHNSDLLQAAARVEQAEALLRQARAAQWPGVDAEGAASRGRSSATTGLPGGGVTANSFRLVATTSFEIDFWGRLRRASEAARAQALASRYGHEVVRQTVAGLVAQSYFSLRALDEQIALTRETLRTREEALRLLRLRLQSGAGGSWRSIRPKGCAPMPRCSCANWSASARWRSPDWGC